MSMYICIYIYLAAKCARNTIRPGGIETKRSRTTLFEVPPRCCRTCGAGGFLGQRIPQPQWAKTAKFFPIFSPCGWHERGFLPRLLHVDGLFTIAGAPSYLVVEWHQIHTGI